METTITIPEDNKELVLNAFADRFGGEEEITSKEDFFKKCILEYVFSVTQNYKEREALKTVNKDDLSNLNVL